jgi:GrpB-like predicted nucleotidyltransferase (UPF0157 family)
MSDRIELVPYDPRWPALFAAEAPRIRAALGEAVIAIDLMTQFPDREDYTAAKTNFVEAVMALAEVPAPRPGTAP